MRSGSFVFPVNALISGLIVGLLLPPETPWYLIAGTAFIAIASKHLLRVKGRPLFNPANIALLVATLFFKVPAVWWGGEPPWAVLVFGGLIAIRFKRLPLIASYALTQMIILGIASSGHGWSIGQMGLLLNPFFMLVMLVEPKSSPVTSQGRILFGGVGGGLTAAFMLLVPTIDPFLAGLAAANLVTPLINLYGRPARAGST
jgi:Na+-translocating ferredoxin:NAD+ oxidoreductase RnfD subunit